MSGTKCTISASFGYVTYDKYGEIVSKTMTHCGEHKWPGMINTKITKCPECDREGSFCYPDVDRIDLSWCCSKHKKPEMV